VAVSEPGVAAGPGGPPVEPVEIIPERGPAAYMAELFGTFGLVFFITMVVSLFVTPPTPQGPGLPPTQPFIDWSVIGLVHVFALFLLIQVLAVASGAHLNPAITVALTAIRQIRPVDAGIYILCQLAGGVLAALVTKGLIKDEGAGVFYGAPGVSDRLDGSTWLGFLAEGVGTFFLVLAVVGVAVNPRATKEWAALVIGGTLGAAVMIIGPLTGAGLNPARSFGPALVAHHFPGSGAGWFVVFFLGPIVGGLLAAVGYFYLYILPGKKGPLGMEPVG
jgi:glycerol uptake facilitator protein